MLVKKFEAPSLKEAMEHIKRELGPEAIILETKSYRKGFGLLSKPSVEITAAVSERSLQKKKWIDSKLPKENKEEFLNLSASQQAKLYDSYVKRRISAFQKNQEQEPSSQVHHEEQKTISPKVTATRYVDIYDEADDKSQPKIPEPFFQEKPAHNKQDLLKTKKTKPSWGKGHVPTSYLAPAVVQAAMKEAPRSVELQALKEELDRMKRMMSELKSQQVEQENINRFQEKGNSLFQNSVFQNVYDQLILSGLRKQDTYWVLNKVFLELSEEERKNPDYVLDHLCECMLSQIEVEYPFPKQREKKIKEESPFCLALVGPTGVGKTTTLAKMASFLKLNEKLKVAMINVDAFRVAARAQLNTFAKLLNIPFRHVENKEALKIALSELKHFDVLLIDTAGRSQKDVEALRKMKELLLEIPCLSIQLTLSISTRDAELFDISRRFQIFRPDGLVFTKMDESLVYGSIYSVAKFFKIPITFLTNGQKVPEDIEQATKKKILSLIFE